MNQWKAPRTPCEDDMEEERRTSDYWAWLNENKSQISDGAMIVYAERSHRWVLLENKQDADYEALHMQHSIGHSWDKYSKIGKIYSLRDTKNKPIATVLVMKGNPESVVHARERRNARLSEENMKKLIDFASFMKWEIKEEPYPFDVYIGGKGGNLKLTVFERNHDEPTNFSDVVMKGRLGHFDLVVLMAVYMDRKGIDFKSLGIETNADQIVDISHEDTPENTPVTVDDMMQTLRTWIADDDQKQIMHCP